MPTKERQIKAQQRKKRKEEVEAYLMANYRDKTIKEMAAHLGMKYNTLREWAKKMGLGVKQRNDEKKRRIAEVYQDGADDALQQLADEQGMTRGALRVMANRLGIHRSHKVRAAICETVGKQNRGRRKHSAETIEWLRKHYPTHSGKWCAEQLGLSRNAVYNLANVNGIRVVKHTKTAVKAAERYQRRQEADAATQRGTIPYNQWIHQHDDDIKNDFPNSSTEDMASEYGVNYYTVSRRASRLGMSKSEAFMRSCWASSVHKKRTHTKEQMEDYLKEHFADTKNAELATHLGVDVKTIRRWARRLGLQKTEGFMQQARASKRNKYYTDEQNAWRQQRAAEAWRDGDEETVQRVAAELGIKRKYLRGLAYKAGAKRSKELVSEAIEKGRLRRTKYTPELIAAIREYFPDHTNEEVAQRFGLNIGTLKQVAIRLGMKKSKEHKRKVYRQNLANKKPKPP